MDASSERHGNETERFGVGRLAKTVIGPPDGNLSVSTQVWTAGSVLRRGANIESMGGLEGSYL
jgi:hypothetical protein